MSIGTSRRRRPKTSLVVDEARASAAAVTASHVSAAVQMATEGRTVGLLHDANAREDVPIVLRLPRSAQGSLAAVRELRLGPDLVAVGELTREETRTEADSLYHKNLLPVTYVTGDLAGAAESPVYAILRMNERHLERWRCRKGTRSRSTTRGSRSTRRSTP